MRNNKSNKGFTLIELLIVIAIIGILAAVLIPNLMGARTRAYDTAAQACANAIATGQEMRIIDDLDYLAVDDDNVSDLQGTNACTDDLEITNGTAIGVASYSATVGHGASQVTFTVTENGINRN